MLPLKGLAIMVNDNSIKEHKSQSSELFAPTDRATRLARILSDIANPLFVALPLFLIISLRIAPDVLHALLWWGIIVVGMCVLPFLFVWRGVRRGTYTDQQVSVREQRRVPLLMALGCIVVVFLLLLVLQAPRLLLMTITSVLVTLGFSIVITRYWKISLHLVGIAGAVTGLALLFGPYWLLLSPLVVIVAWARWQVRAHTVLQACAGTLLAIASTLIIFALSNVLPR